MTVTETKLKTFGQRVRSVRISKGLSQSQLAKMTGYSGAVSISKIEKDKMSPSIHALTKIAEVLGFGIHWLVTGQISFICRDILRQAKIGVLLYLGDIESEITHVHTQLTDLEFGQAFRGEDNAKEADELRKVIHRKRKEYDTVQKKLTIIENQLEYWTV